MPTSISNMTELELDTLNESQRCLAQFVESAFHRVVCPFVRMYGTFFTPTPLPKGIRPGGIGVCFANSYRLLKRHGKRLGLAYAEGYAISENVEMNPTLHAWCVDRDGTVYDPTWKNGRAYFGIAFKRDYVFDTIKQRETNGDLYFGLLDDWANRYPLIRNLGNRSNIWQHYWEDAPKK